MKRMFTLSVLFLFSAALWAQTGLSDAQKVAMEAAETIQSAPKADPVVPKPKYWTNSLQTKLDLGQTSLTNWAAGGYNTVSLKTFIDGNANFKKNEMFWNNRLQLDYGFLYSADKPFLQKSDDRIYLESKWGYQATKNLYYSAQFNFRSQFSNSWEYPVPTEPVNKPEDWTPEGWEPKKADWMAKRKLKSGMLSPAYTNLALGLDYKPLKWLTVNLAPLTGGFVIVDNPLLRKSYSQPLKKEFENVAKDDLPKDETTGAIRGTCYKAAKFEFGAQLKVDFKVNVNSNFAFSSQVVLFSDYLDHPENLRVNWDTRIDWKIAKFFSFTIATNLIYDDKVMIKNEKDLDKHPNGIQRIQFKESLSFGFVYTFATNN